MPPLLLPVLLLFATAEAYPAACRNATCGDKTIAYPFWLNTSSASACGYPSLGLLCEDDTTLILPVQPHHQYTVSSIDYSTHIISLVDGNVSDGSSCPRLHFNLTIETNSWLQLTPSDSNMTFLYNCKKNASSTSAVESAVVLRVGRAHWCLNPVLNGSVASCFRRLVVLKSSVSGLESCGGPPLFRSFLGLEFGKFSNARNRSRLVGSVRDYEPLADSFRSY